MTIFFKYVSKRVKKKLFPYVSTEKNGIEHIQADLNKMFLCVAYISIIFSLFSKKIKHFEGLLIFFVFLCKMRDVTDQLQIGPMLWEYFGVCQHF